MDVQVLKDYRDVSEKIGKLYSDLETLEARRAQLEQQIHNGSRPAAVVNEPSGITVVKTIRSHVDKMAIPKMREFLKRHWIANKVCTPQMVCAEFGCTVDAAMMRMRVVAREGLGRPVLGPYRLEKP
jgi:hypothetical protein